MQTSTLILALLSYGLILTLVFGLSDRSGAHHPSSMVRMALFLIPALVGAWASAQSGRHATGLGAACIVYAVPALIDGVALVIFSKAHGRWLVAATPFVIALLIQFTRYGVFQA
jgi:hypothetical protein